MLARLLPDHRRRLGQVPENSTADPDGNEVDTNVVQGNFVCSGNNPAAQVGDSGGFPNIAFGKATGECASLTGP